MIPRFANNCIVVFGFELLPFGRFHKSYSDGTGISVQCYGVLFNDDDIYSIYRVMKTNYSNL